MEFEVETDRTAARLDISAPLLRASDRSKL